MKRLTPLVLCVPLASCSIERNWPAGMKAETYSGRILRESTGKPVGGAEIELKRRGKKFSKSLLGGWAAVQTPELIGTGTSKADGSFQITTRSGYATSAAAQKGELYGSIGSSDQNHSESKRLPNILKIEVK